MSVEAASLTSERNAPISGASSLADAARNLLLNCAEVEAGDRVVILAEDPELGWYDATCPSVTAKVARDLGAEVVVLPIGSSTEPLDPAMELACNSADVRIFFARIGDRTRFALQPERGVTVMVYARTATAFGADFGTRHHGEMLRLKDRVNAELFSAREIRISCPFGTEIIGSPPSIGAEPDDVTVRRFPMCMPAPMPARGYSGKVALTSFLTPTGSRDYEPANLKLRSVVFARIENGRVCEFEGESAEVDAIRRHYALVSERFCIDSNAVHSWHAGIHAGCWFDGRPDDNPDLWSNSVFGHPRYLHFHTCGDYAPGEICWMVAEPTIVADGKVLWADGSLHVH